MSAVFVSHLSGTAFLKRTDSLLQELAVNKQHLSYGRTSCAPPQFCLKGMHGHFQSLAVFYRRFSLVSPGSSVISIRTWSELPILQLLTCVPSLLMENDEPFAYQHLLKNVCFPHRFEMPHLYLNKYTDLFPNIFGVLLISHYAQWELMVESHHKNPSPLPPSRFCILQTRLVKYGGKLASYLGLRCSSTAHEDSV